MSELLALIAEIRETQRMHQDLLRAELRLGQQIAAILRRFSQADAGRADESVSTVETLPCHPVSVGVLTTRGNLKSTDNNGTAGLERHDTQVQLAGTLLADDQNELAIHPPSVESNGESGLSGSVSLPIIADLATLPLREAKDGIHKHQMRLRRRLEKLARDLPCWMFVESVPGFGAFGCAQIIGEAGDLTNYATVSRLWKRMGLAVINGGAQRRVRGDEALEHGFSVTRRTIMHVIGDSLIKKQNLYRDLYLSRKAYEEEQLPEASKMHRHLRALRYAEKRLLRDLWVAWRRALKLPEAFEAAA